MASFVQTLDDRSYSRRTRLGRRWTPRTRRNHGFGDKTILLAGYKPRHTEVCPQLRRVRKNDNMEDQEAGIVEAVASAGPHLARDIC